MTTFKLNGTIYQITKIEEVAEDLKYVREMMIKTGKETKHYYASKVLKNGSLSKKVGGMFLKFSESGNFISAI